MKFCLAATLAALASQGASAFAPVSKPAVASSPATALGALPSIWSTLGSLEGPSVCWGPEGVIIGHEEIEIKEYDNFTMFLAALKQNNLENKLKAIGPYTLLVPTDSAVQQYKGVLDEETLSYHIILQDLYSDEFDGEFETLSGHKVTLRYEFRKSYADNGESSLAVWSVLRLCVHCWCSWQPISLSLHVPLEELWSQIQGRVHFYI